MFPKSVYGLPQGGLSLAIWAVSSDHVLRKPGGQVDVQGEGNNTPLPLPCGNMFDLQSFLRRSRGPAGNCQEGQAVCKEKVPLS